MQSSVCPYFGILAENPFPLVKGCVCLVGSASCRAFGHTRPASVPGLSVGLPPSPRLGLRPKPHFQKLYRFIDSLNCVCFRHSFYFFAEKLLTIVRNRIIISLSPISDLTICRQGESAWIIKTTEKNCMNIIMY